MDEIKLGGFPPLVRKNLKIDKNQKELKPQYFANFNRQNINIREILTKKQENSFNEKIESLEEVEEI